MQTCKEEQEFPARIVEAGTGLLDVKADQDIDNSQGTLAGNGATRVNATTNLLNDGGLINAHGATTIAAASLSNTANGAISGGTFSAGRESTRVQSAPFQFSLSAPEKETFICA